MERWIGRVALVTGASAGIGEAVAKRLVCHGMKVVGCSRNIEKIQEMANELNDEKGSLTAIQCDVANEEQVLAMFKSIEATHGVVDVVINNAALMVNTQLLTGKTEDWRSMFDVNVVGLCTCTREAVKLMEEKGVDDGHIFMMNSLLGYKMINVAYLNIYSATKFALAAVTEGLRNELAAKNSHIRVTGICLGLTQTSAHKQLFPDDPEQAKAMYTTMKSLTPDNVADSLVHALSAPKGTQVQDISVVAI